VLLTCPLYSQLSITPATLVLVQSHKIVPVICPNVTEISKNREVIGENVMKIGENIAEVKESIAEINENVTSEIIIEEPFSKL
jgi:hypothetical protein